MTRHSLRIVLPAVLLSLCVLNQSSEGQGTNPVVVTGLTVSSKTPSSVFLSWNETIMSKPNFTVQWSDGTNKTSNTFYTVTNLIAGVNYTFTVTVENQTTGGAQISSFTNPDVVTNLNVSSKTTSSVSLTWNKPQGNCSLFIINWTSDSINNSNNTSTITSYTVTNLTAGVNYTFTVTAVAADKQTEGAPTQISTFTNPDVVTNLNVSRKTTSSVTLNWNKPQGNWSFFTVAWNNDSVISSTNTLNTLYTVTGLTAGVNYTFTVSAVAADNQTVGKTAQTSVFTNPDVVSNLTATDKKASSVSLTWNEPNRHGNQFEVKWTDSNGTSGSNNILTTSYTVTNLTAGVNYTFTVTAVAGDNQTAGAPIQISLFTVPAAVSNVIASTSNQPTSSVFLSWNEPNGGRSFFKVNWIDSNLNSSKITYNTSYTVTGLIAGVKYTFTVTAVAADEQTAGAPTQISVFTRPDVVTTLSVSYKTASSVSLTWNKPNGTSNYFIVTWTVGNENKSSNTSVTSYNVTGLTAGVNYTFTVTAVAADNQTIGAPTQISAFTKPNCVTNLIAANKNTSSVSLTWNQPNGTWKRFIVKSTGGSRDFSSNSSMTSYTATGLTAGVNYTFTVTAVAADEQTEGAPTQISTFTNPDVVTNLIASNKTTSSVILNWSQPNGTSNYFIVTWTVGNENKSSNTSVTPYNVTGLTAGVNYTFTVTAVAEDNQTIGAPTQISAFTNPDVVTTLSVSSKTTSSVSLTWNKPNGTSNYFIVTWTVGNENKSSNTSVTSYNVTGLTAGVNYTFTVTAVAADNQTIGAPTQISAFTNPDVVTNLTVSSKTTSSVSLTWNKPQGNCSFIINWTSDSINNSSNTSTNTSYTVTNLAAGVNYTFTVTAVAADKQSKGAPTQISTFTRPDVASNLTASSKTTSSVSLTWNEPQGNCSIFIVNWTDKSLNNSSNTSITSYTVTGLTAGVNYTFTVTAVAADGQTKGESIQISAFTKPENVCNLSTVNVTTTSILLYWNETMGKISHYVIQYENFDITVNTITESSRITITNLTPGVQYTFKVFAVAADNLTEGNYSSVSAYTKPDVPTDLRVTEITTSSLFLNWTQPVGERIYFNIQWNNDNVTYNSTTRTPFYNVTNLSAGVRYTVLISAVAADNTTAGEAINVSAYTKPETVSNLSTVNVTTTSILLYWNETMGKISHYVIQYEIFDITVNTITESSRITITNLTPGVQYTFKVFAVAADNLTEGNYSSVSAYTKPETITNLTSFGVSTTTVFLDWGTPSGQWSFFSINVGQWTTHLTSFNFTDLKPGTNYSFAVSAVAADNNTESSPVGLSTCTDTSPVFDIMCDGPNRTAAALLYLTWKNPDGDNQGFNISLNQTASDFVPHCNHVCNYNFSRNLKYFTTYSVIISTLGCGESGTKEVTCKTGITEPPVPSRPEDIEIRVTPISQSQFNLQFNDSLLNSSNGPIDAYGVLLLTDQQSNISSSFLTMTYTDWTQGKTKAYLTVLKLNENKKTRSNLITVVVGNYTDVLENTSYQNGPLRYQEYRVALVLFSYLEIKDQLVDTQRSIYSITPIAPNAAKPVEPSSSTIAIILGVLLPIVLLLIIVIIVLIIQKRRITKEYTDIPVNNLRTKVSIPVRVEDFEAYYKKQQLDSNCGFAEQYEDLKVVGTAQTKNSALALDNKGKNRYNNVLPYDSSRVKLSIHGSPFDDYINANYISGYNSKKEYIAAQGPLPATVNEFWRMIWEKHVHTIVMLTKCYEQGRVKCEKYWPLETKLYSNILVATTSEIELEDWTVRDLTIKNVKTAETRNVRQFHFTAWPDHGVPETTEVLINFRHLVREHMDSFSHNAPAVVHCSAGVGRTGTFIAVDHLIFQVERESMVDIYGIIYDMRMHRPLMVQTEDQYVFLNQCASDVIKSRMGTNVDLIYQNAAAFSIYENVQN